MFYNITSLQTTFMKKKYYFTINNQVVTNSLSKKKKVTNMFIELTNTQETGQAMKLAKHRRIHHTVLMKNLL